MSRPRQAFTLIELLVVIAIIAILAAILFPVFAQAKLAAKKTASLAQIKQVGTGVQIYLSDSDDVFPLAFGQAPWGIYAFDWGHDVPADLYGDDYPELVPVYASSWANSTMPYTKSKNLLEIPGVRTVDAFDPSFSDESGKLAKIGLSYNGLLHGYPSSGVAAGPGLAESP